MSMYSYVCIFNIYIYIYSEKTYTPIHRHLYIYIIWLRSAPWTAPIQIRPRSGTESHPALSKIHSALCKHVKLSTTK